MLGCSASAQGVPGKAVSCAVTVRGSGEHQPASHENLHTTHYRRQRTTWRPGGRQEKRWGSREKHRICHVVVFSSEGRHERLVLWETRLWQKEKKKTDENTTQRHNKTQKSHIRQALLWSTCPCLTSYWTFPKKHKETEVEMNVGELEQGFQDEKPTCSVKSEVKMRDE